MSANLKAKPLSPTVFTKLFSSAAIVNDSDYLWGQTTFRNSRVLASTLFEYLADGKTIDDFLVDFPTSREAVLELLQDMQEMLTP